MHFALNCPLISVGNGKNRQSNSGRYDGKLSIISDKRNFFYANAYRHLSNAAVGHGKYYHDDSGKYVHVEGPTGPPAPPYVHIIGPEGGYGGEGGNGDGGGTGGFGPNGPGGPKGPGGPGGKFFSANHLKDHLLTHKYCLPIVGPKGPNGPPGPPGPPGMLGVRLGCFE